ncbi:MAG: VWA domain-containing protein [Candidatus Eisenbacteria bacterium]
MRFAAPEFLHLLWILPILGIWWIFRIRRAEADLARWCGHPLWSRMVPDRRVWAPYVKAVLVLLAGAFLAVAAARPQVGSRVVEMKKSGIDVIVALDVSESMLAEDLSPDRITRAKQEIGSLIDRLKGDRIGLVAFAGDAFVQCPLTLDYGAARMFLRYMDTGLVPIPGTAIARAVDVAVKAHEVSDAEDFQAVVLITDGEDHEGDVQAAAERAVDAGVKVFAVGIGTAKGEPIPVRDARGNVKDYKRDRNGEVILTKCDAATLEALCRTTGGRYFDGGSGGLALDRLYEEIESMEERELEGGWATEFEDRYGYFVAAALFLLLLDWLIGTRKRFGRARRRLLRVATATATTATLLLGLTGLGVGGSSAACEGSGASGWSGGAPGVGIGASRVGFGAIARWFGPTDAYADEGTSAYGKGEFEAARDFYEAYGRENPDDPRVDYNLGTTLYQTRELDPSESSLQRALRADDPKLRARAFYNLGDVQVKKGDLEAAREVVPDGVIHDPSDRDAKTNFEIVDRLLRGPPDSSQQNQDQNQDQQNQDQQDQQNQDQQQDQQQQQQQNQGSAATGPGSAGPTESGPAGPAGSGPEPRQPGSAAGSGSAATAGPGATGPAARSGRPAAGSGAAGSARTRPSSRLLEARAGRAPDQPRGGPSSARSTRAAGDAAPGGADEGGREDEEGGEGLVSVMQNAAALCARLVVPSWVWAASVQLAVRPQAAQVRRSIEARGDDRGRDVDRRSRAFRRSTGSASAGPGSRRTSRS